MDSSAPSILPPWVWLSSTPPTLLSFIVKFVLYFSLHCEKNENKQKEAGFGTFLKRNEHERAVGFSCRPKRLWWTKMSLWTSVESFGWSLRNYCLTESGNTNWDDYLLATPSQDVFLLWSRKEVNFLLRYSIICVLASPFYVGCRQCDQIGRFFTIWVTFQMPFQLFFGESSLKLGNFWNGTTFCHLSYYYDFNKGFFYLTTWSHWMLVGGGGGGGAWWPPHEDTPV